MRHAFLIEAHHNWWQLEMLIRQLDDPNHDIYVHVDLKSKDFKAENFKNCTAHSTVRIFQQYKVYWGGYSQVEVELRLFEEAYAVGYDYYHVISGDDLCLWTPEQIQIFFEEHQGMEFIGITPTQSPEVKRRTQLYHFLHTYRRRFPYPALNRCFTFLDRFLLALQLVLGVNRVKNQGWGIIFGSNWVSITHALVEVILNNRNKIERIFRFTNSCDELFVQTIAWNCGFRWRIYRLDEGTDNLRYIDWSSEKDGNPHTFRLEDYEVIQNSGAMFARKFSETVDREIIQKIVGSI